MRAAKGKTGAAIEMNGADLAGGAAAVARSDRRRHLGAEDLVEQAGRRVAVEHQCVHLILLSGRSARS